LFAFLFFWHKPAIFFGLNNIFINFTASTIYKTMVYRFTIISDEVDDFLREIRIDSEATFYDFHEIILQSVGFTNDQMTSFFLCDDNWEKENEITVEEMDNSPEYDSWVMKDTALSELIEDEKQKLIYVFDNLTERVFFIELSEIITGKELKKPICSRKVGNPPKQSVDFEEMATGTSSIDLDENFYGDEDFDVEEFDPEGFDNLDIGEETAGTYEKESF